MTGKDGIRLKKYIINKYYDFLMSIEDFLGYLETAVNNHRRKIDDKYWEKYLYKGE
jgi:hypothetical protein